MVFKDVVEPLILKPVHISLSDRWVDCMYASLAPGKVRSGTVCKNQGAVISSFHEKASCDFHEFSLGRHGIMLNVSFMFPS